MEAQRGPSQGPESGLDLNGQPWGLPGAGVQSGPGLRQHLAIPGPCRQGPSGRHSTSQHRLSDWAYSLERDGASLPSDFNNNIASYFTSKRFIQGLQLRICEQWWTTGKSRDQGRGLATLGRRGSWEGL